MMIRFGLVGGIELWNCVQIYVKANLVLLDINAGVVGLGTRPTRQLVLKPNSRQLLL